MKLVAVIGATLIFAVGGFAQRPRVVGTPSGFGNILFPGTGGVPAATTGRVQARLPFSITDTTFGQRLAGTVSGSRPYRGGNGGGRGVVYMPYAYPVYVGTGYGYDQPQQQPNVVVVYPQQQQQAPVVINQQFAQPPMQMAPQEQSSASEIKLYQAPSRNTQETLASDPGASGYLFAFKDNSIYSAVAYWVDGDTLHYFTNGNTHNQVSLSLVDRTLTERLNRERGVDLRLPAAAQ
jgi:hypothetical protein